DGFFRIRYPENWQVYPSTSGYGTTIAPPGGVIDGSQGQGSIVYGVIINHYDPFESNGSSAGASLSEATDDVVRQITRTNSYLRATGARRREVVDGQQGLSVVLAGRSPSTGEE